MAFVYSVLNANKETIFVGGTTEHNNIRELIESIEFQIHREYKPHSKLIRFFQAADKQRFQFHIIGHCGRDSLEEHLKETISEFAELHPLLNDIDNPYYNETLKTLDHFKIPLQALFQAEDDKPYVLYYLNLVKRFKAKLAASNLRRG